MKINAITQKELARLRWIFLRIQSTASFIFLMMVMHSDDGYAFK
jgi:hypothetical protein